ncbi:sulfotransferase [Neptunicoccus sediminis]|uniref:sulfotransferase n=1 Tax=Neptunicoccus sediminis TaxID=1892596 RepID=UPI000845E9E6|nr:sulfotransferase [Neptunicoccus sediminis]
MSNNIFVLGFGAQKTGSTWVANYLKSHPQVYVSPIKELHFFRYFDEGGAWPNSFFENQLNKCCSELRREALADRLAMENDLAAYQGYFKKRMSAETHFCDITPAYSLLPLSELQRIRSHFNRVKPFVILRNPADRFWSQVKFDARNDEGPNLGVRLNDALSDQNYLKRSDYLGILGRLHTGFSEEEVYVDFYENFFSYEGIAKFCNFLEIEYLKPQLDVVKNSSSAAKMRKGQRKRIVKRLCEQYEFCDERFGSSLPSSWQYDLSLSAS